MEEALVERLPPIIDTAGTDHPVRWKGGNLDPTGEPIRLRFFLRQSRLYSFQIH